MTIVVQEKKLDISYDSSKCNRCGLCLEVCPFNVWELPVEGPAIIARPEDCTNCTACAKNCLGSAISVANIGCGCIWNEASRRQTKREDKLVGAVDEEQEDSCGCGPSCCG
ncbi:MAG: 4Fe-4S dicluster domain-containing protein [Candidatus Thorarchaeota archaeon]|jgi:NAD-dependent dihydropyrimidine dehydrogenase PreA subunit